MSAVKEVASVDRYARQVMDMRAMLMNMRDFIDTLPAPDDDYEIPNMNYAQLGTLNEMHSLLTAASECADAIADE